MCWRMIPASARRARFTEAESGKTSNTSGSNTTKLLPAANRLAYLPDIPVLKSYSTCISGSGLPRGSFAICPSFPWCREPGADDTDIIFPLSMYHNQDSAQIRCPNGYKAVLWGRPTEYRRPIRRCVPATATSTLAQLLSPLGSSFAAPSAVKVVGIYSTPPI